MSNPLTTVPQRHTPIISTHLELALEAVLSSADAGLVSLKRREPDLAELRSLLMAIATAGNLAAELAGAPPAPGRHGMSGVYSEPRDSRPDIAPSALLATTTGSSAKLGPGEGSAATVSSEATPTRGGLAPWQLRAVCGYVEVHLSSNVRVNALASLVRLSTSHFCRAFKVSTGETAHTYVMRRRLARAQMLMLGSEDGLGQIAAACGLSDQAHLTRLFRRWLGQTPYNWRRQNLDASRGRPAL